MAQNGGADAVDTTGKVPEGIVLPPKDIRAIVEKTAGYVARNGPVFEDRIRDKEQSNSKFSFLSPNDAYAPFYQWRLSEVRAGRNADLSGRVGGATPAPAKPKGPEPLPEYQFSARMPNISSLDLEVLRLTALHVARKGKSWMTNLSQKEARNFQFDFLRPQHSLYNFFQRMVDQYSLLLQTGPEGQKAEQARIREIQDNLHDRFRTLNKAKKRSEYVRHQEKQKQQKEEAEEAERIAYAQVDWHDFVVVETVLFTEADDQAELPPPTTLNDLQSASLEQKAMMSLSRPDMRIEEAMPDSDMGAYAGYQDSYDAYNGYQQGYPSTTPGLPSPSPGVPQAFPPQQNFIPFPQTSTPQPPQVPSPAPDQPAQREPAPMRIRQDYVPRAQQRTQQSAQTSICPNCKQRIPIAELDEHLRIELLDPSWQEQQRKNAERFSSTGVGGMDVVANLKRLRAQAEGGSSDPVAEAAARVLNGDEQAQKRAKGASGEAVVYPGPSVTREQGKGLSVDEQIRNLQTRYGM